MQIKTNFTKKEWIKENQIKGSTLTILGTVWKEAQLIEKIPDDKEIDFFQTSIEKLTGFFSIIYQSGNSMFAAVDHIRSHPLFYGTLGEIFFLSDNAEWVREQIREEHIDPIAREEFLLTGFVTGQDTLFANLKQLQAGEYLVVKNGKIKITRYFKFLHIEPEQWNEKELFDELDLITRKSIQRLIEYANGRQIVVPLSGGYDSRLIVTLLKELGYENVLTFTYGVEGNKESEYSKIVANRLGLKWYFVEYTPELWQREWKDESRKKYYEYASNHVSLPHTQDWLAVKLMKERGEIEKEAVFVPGHCCVTGFINEGVLSETWTQEDTIRDLFQKHFSLRPAHWNMYLNISETKNKIIQLTGSDLNDQPHTIASQMMSLNWAERQCKFTSNSVRVYEFFGYDWWLPLWDYNFILFWKVFPLSLRLNRVFYIRYVTDLFEKNTTITAMRNASDRIEAIQSARNLLRCIPVVETTLRKLYLLFIIKKDKLMSSRFGYRAYKSLVRKGYSHNGIAAYCFMKEWDNRWGVDE